MFGHFVNMNSNDDIQRGVGNLVHVSGRRHLKRTEHTILYETTDRKIKEKEER